MSTVVCVCMESIRCIQIETACRWLIVNAITTPLVCCNTYQVLYRVYLSNTLTFVICFLLVFLCLVSILREQENCCIAECFIFPPIFSVIFLMFKDLLFYLNEMYKKKMLQWQKQFYVEAIRMWDLDNVLTFWTHLTVEIWFLVKIQTILSADRKINEPVLQKEDEHI